LHDARLALGQDLGLELGEAELVRDRLGGARLSPVSMTMRKPAARSSARAPASSP
jgi:hypothetical protein